MEETELDYKPYSQAYKKHLELEKGTKLEYNEYLNLHGPITDTVSIVDKIIKTKTLPTQFSFKL